MGGSAGSGTVAGCAGVTGTGTGAGTGTGTTGRGGGAAQLATRSEAATARIIGPARKVRDKESDMGWVFLEIVVALAVAVAIVWWTLPRKPKPPEGTRGPDKDG